MTELESQLLSAFEALQSAYETQERQWRSDKTSLLSAFERLSVKFENQRKGLLSALEKQEKQWLSVFERQSQIGTQEREALSKAYDQVRKNFEQSQAHNTILNERILRLSKQVEQLSEQVMQFSRKRS